MTFEEWIATKEGKQIAPESVGKFLKECWDIGYESGFQDAKDENDSD